MLYRQKGHHLIMRLWNSDEVGISGWCVEEILKYKGAFVSLRITANINMN